MRYRIITVVILCLLSVCGIANGFAKGSDEDVERKIDLLLGKMTVEEKVGQLVQTVLNYNKIDEIKERVRSGEIGSFTIVKNYPTNPEIYNEIQKCAMESRMQVPIFFGLDVIHGYTTMYPNPLGMAATWDEQAVERACSLAASEAAPMGADVTYSPNVDICRDPRFGRIAESPGEDVLMACRIAEASIRGYQGDDMSAPDKIAACTKHLVGYGAVLGGRDKQFTEISDRTLLDVYLPSFKTAVESGSAAFMSAFNDISGVPASANSYVMNDLLRKSWGFDGFILSDWDSVIELINHGVAGGTRDAAAIALESGVDIEMNSDCYDKHLVTLVKEGKITMQTLDDAVRRVLRIKYRLGLFDNPYRSVNAAKGTQLTDDNRKIVRDIASASMVLLKNSDQNGDRVLPLKDAEQRVVVTGQMAHTNDLYGHWKGYGQLDDVVTPWQGLLANKLNNIELIDGKATTVTSGDVAIVCVGEKSSDFGESDNMSDITLQPQYVQAVKEARAKFDKVVVVVFCGRPLVLTPIVDDADAILIAWHPGTEAGNALADVLYGTVNPSGKTPVTFLKSTGQVPIYYCDRLSGRPRNNNYIDIDAEPLFPFGFGLNYSYLTYSKLRVSKSSMSKSVDGDSITVSVNVRNQGNDCSEVVQLYIHDIIASVTQPKILLKDFNKVFIRKGETKVVSFTLYPKQLSFHNQNLEEVIEPGEFDIWVGASSAQEDLLHKNITLTE